MALITIAPVIYERFKRKDNTYSVRIRVYYKKVKLISTNIVARPDQLTKRLTVKDPILKSHIDTLTRQMQEVANAIPLYELKDMTVDDVIRKIDFKLRAPYFELDFPSYGEKIANEKPTNSKSNYMVAIHSLCKFMGTYSFDISRISSSLMHNYETYLKKKHGQDARAISLYTRAIAYIHKRARQEFNNEESGETNIRNPFAHYQCPRPKPTQHRNIDTAIVQMMINHRHELKGRERLGVDLFLISFAFMGMNTPDVYSCNKPEKGVVRYERTKTRDRRSDRAEMRIKIEPCMKNLLSEYIDTEGSDRFFNFHRKYKNYKQLGLAANRGLVLFCQRMNIRQKITIYCARHTWSTLAYSIGVPESTINTCLCHVDSISKVNSIYINRDWSIAWQANKQVLSYFKWD